MLQGTKEWSIFNTPLHNIARRIVWCHNILQRIFLEEFFCMMGNALTQGYPLDGGVNAKIEDTAARNKGGRGYGCVGKS
jgi:hypothetical protein